jgi:hypothetical protein
MAKIKYIVDAECGDARESARLVKKLAVDLHHLEEQQRVKCAEIEQLLRAQLSLLVVNRNAKLRELLENLLARMERLRELRNMQELGSFMLDCNRACEAVYEDTDL